MAFKFSKGKRGFGDITFEDDADTGIDFEADTVKIETGGSERLVVKNNGSETRVGIGTANPQTILHVSADDPRIRAEATAGNHPGFELSEAGSRKWLVFNDPANDNLVFKSDANKVAIQQDGTVELEGDLVVKGRVEAKGAVYKRIRTVCASSQSYTVAADDYIILVAGSGARTINLPAIANQEGRILIIKDAVGNAGTGGNNNNITISPATGDEIDGNNVRTMQNNHKSLTLVCASDQWYRLSEFESN